MVFSLVYKPYGERSVLIEWPSEIDEDLLHDILSFKEKIFNNDIKLIVDVIHSYNSLLVIYDYFLVDFDKQITLLKKVYRKKEKTGKPIFKLWKIPVCYDAVFGIDLEAMSQAKNISKEAIITCHSQPTYLVYFIGFLPGFLYLGGLKKNLHFPRKEMPRLKIRKGAVAIGGNQTGVYPSEGPGGWNIIGNTPISFFNISKSRPCFAKPGDRIAFFPISLQKYRDIETLVKAGVYQIESEVLYG